jgi:hypothetical protein
MEKALGIATVNYIGAFRCSPVSFELLVTFGGKSESNWKSPQDTLTTIEDK